MVLYFHVLLHIESFLSTQLTLDTDPELVAELDVPGQVGGAGGHEAAVEVVAPRPQHNPEHRSELGALPQPHLVPQLLVLAQLDGELLALLAPLEAETVVLL